MIFVSVRYTCYGDAEFAPIIPISLEIVLLADLHHTGSSLHNCVAGLCELRPRPGCEQPPEAQNRCLGPPSRMVFATRVCLLGDETMCWATQQMRSFWSRIQITTAVFSWIWKLEAAWVGLVAALLPCVHQTLPVLGLRCVHMRRQITFFICHAYLACSSMPPVGIR